MQVLGYALLNVFGALDAPEEQPVDPSEPCTLNRGAFQLPILLSTLDRSHPLSVHSLPWESRLPCASVLVGEPRKASRHLTTACAMRCRTQHARFLCSAIHTCSTRAPTHSQTPAPSPTPGPHTDPFGAPLACVVLCFLCDPPCRSECSQPPNHQTVWYFLAVLWPRETGGGLAWRSHFLGTLQAGTPQTCWRQGMRSTPCTGSTLTLVTPPPWRFWRKYKPRWVVVVLPPPPLTSPSGTALVLEQGGEGGGNGEGWEVRPCHADC